jgi:hypothetical protein
MVETIRAYARSDASVLGQQALSERVLEAMGQTKRHLFIPERSCSIAYADRPIPIGHGQTMSQPFIVASALESLELAKRVAATPADQRHKLSPAEKMAALRSPALSGITPSVAEAWTADILKATAPERLAAHDDGNSALEEVAEALTMARQSLQAAGGFIDAETGLPSQAWSAFEREHMAPVAAELAKVDAAAEQKRNAEAVAQNVESFAAAIKAMPYEARSDIVNRVLDSQLADLKAS